MIYLSFFYICNLALFKSLLNVNYCLRHLYPDKRHNVHTMTLRPRGHIFRFLNAGCKERETRSLIGYCLHVCNAQFILIFVSFIGIFVNQSDWLCSNKELVYLLTYIDFFFLFDCSYSLFCVIFLILSLFCLAIVPIKVFNNTVNVDKYIQAYKVPKVRIL